MTEQLEIDSIAGRAIVGAHPILTASFLISQDR